MKIVVDTNIVFSSLISKESKISDLLFRIPSKLDFYAPIFLLDELNEHNSKLVDLSKFSIEELNFQKKHILNKIILIDLELIQNSNWTKAIDICKDIDPSDSPFLALAF